MASACLSRSDCGVLVVNSEDSDDIEWSRNVAEKLKAKGKRVVCTAPGPVKEDFVSWGTDISQTISRSLGDDSFAVAVLLCSRKFLKQMKTKDSEISRIVGLISGSGKKVLPVLKNASLREYQDAMPIFKRLSPLNADYPSDAEDLILNGIRKALDEADVRGTFEGKEEQPSVTDDTDHSHSVERAISRQQNFPYDVFVCFNEDQKEWVKTVLLPEMEGNLGLKACVHYRDFIPGKSIVTNIINSITASRQVVFVFSKGFERSGWCHYELTSALALVNGVFERQKRESAVIGVVTGNVEKPLELAGYTVVHSESDHFWSQLRRALH